MNADLYNILVHLHSIGRWIVLLLLLIAIFKSISAGNAPFTRSHMRTGSMLSGFADLMFLVGIALWFFGERGGYKILKNNDFGAVMKNDVARFFAIEHMAAMLIAIILIHIGKSQGKKALIDRVKHRRTWIFYFVALLIILVSIPWPFREQLGGNWY